MKKNRLQKVFLEELKKVPVVHVSCEKSGLSRNTVYRWRKEDKNFAEEMDKAIAEGVAVINDMSEIQIINLIQEKNFNALSFWLRSRHAAYKPKVEVTASVNTIQELSPEQENMVKEALALAGIKSHETD